MYQARYRPWERYPQGRWALGSRKQAVCVHFLLVKEREGGGRGQGREREEEAGGGGGGNRNCFKTSYCKLS